MSLISIIRRFLHGTDPIVSSAIPSRQALGLLGEEVAERWLHRNRGFRTLVRNWHSGRDEIDLIAWDERVLVFVEVRTRKSGSLVSGYHSIRTKKKKALLRACRHYLSSLKNPPTTFRFDVVEIEHDTGTIGDIRHYENVPMFPKSFTGEKSSFPL